MRVTVSLSTTDAIRTVPLLRPSMGILMHGLNGLVCRAVREPAERWSIMMADECRALWLGFCGSVVYKRERLCGTLDCAEGVGL